MKTKQGIINYILLISVIIALINFLSYHYSWRFDYTENNRYTLSDATRNILEQLESPVTVTAYFSENLPTRALRIKEEFQNLLIEYANRSNGMVHYEFVNPDTKEKEKEARQAGIPPQSLRVRKQDEFKAQKAYLGAVIKKGGEKEAIPVINQEIPMEYKLSSGIKKLSNTEKPGVAILQGHGEPGLDKLSAVKEQLSVLYNVETLEISGNEIPLKYKSLAIVNPTDTFPRSHLSKIDNYLSNGGNLFIAYNKVSGDLQKRQGKSRYTGIEDFLSAKGIEIEDKYVIDARCQNISVRQQNYIRQMQFPYLPEVINFADHPAAQGIEQMTFKFVSPVSFHGDSTLAYTSLVTSSKNSGTQAAPIVFQREVSRDWREDDFNQSHITLAAAISGNISGENSGKMIVVGDGDFPIGSGNKQRRQRGQQVPEANVNFMVNSIDWLSDDTGLIELRTKGVQSRPLKEVEDTTRNLYKYGNFLLPILIVLVVGIVRMQFKKGKRIKRMEENYA